MKKKRYQNKEMNDAFKRAEKIVKVYGPSLMKASPAYNSRVPESFTSEIGVGMAVGLWAGIHAGNEKSPFEKTSTIHAIYQAGKEWGRYRDLSSLN